MSLTRASGVFFVLFAAAMIWGVIPVQTETVYPDGSIPPHVLPMVYAALVGVFALLVMLQRGDRDTDFDAVQLFKVGIFFLLALAGIAAMTQIGFKLAAPVLAATLLWGAGERRPLWLALGALLGPLAIWAFFEILLGRPLP